ncbi:MAG: ATP-dependent DNA helicase RecG [Synergistaceae bacterium]|nr:ATP-dependent DNA helicase RecG [Synergistaceae bacterium]
MVELSDSVRYIKGVGEQRENLLIKIGITKSEDLLFYFPYRYEDRRTPTKISSLRVNKVGEKSLIIARVAAVEKRSTNRKKFTVTSALICDEEGNTAQAVWFNIPNLEKTLTPGKLVSLYGKVEFRGLWQITSPELEVLDDESDANLGIMPVYPTTSGLSQKMLRRIINSAIEAVLPKLSDFIPENIRKNISLAQAIETLHHPSDRSVWAEARKRLVFDEFFLLQVGFGLRKRMIESKAAPNIIPGGKFNSFLASLSFSLTAAQSRVLNEIVDDIKKVHPMNRLLQGDVGSGKTVIAAAALCAALDSGKQGALMVPTEILAQQHYARLSKMLPNVAILSRSLNTQERKSVIEGLKTGEIKIVIGTHALLSENVEFSSLGLVIVDEQHRFGVLQKQSLISKGFPLMHPHVLVMTATPIPRTLTLSVYGDLSVSVIDELPPGRQPVETRAVSNSKLANVLQFVKKGARLGRQIYWVCPLIEDSENIDIASAVNRCDELRNCLGLRTELMHGRLNGNMKNSIMQEFESGNIDLLVSTSVIEVGVDVPNASIMVIEGADRFGLSQLHQLRGRIGRGAEKGWCILVSNPKTPEGGERIEAMTQTADGFKIAEIDLKLRGPGEVCGIRQHGITDFRVADLIRDRKILLEARAEAEKLLDSDPELKSEPLLLKAVMERIGTALDIAGTA